MHCEVFTPQRFKPCASCEFADSRNAAPTVPTCRRRCEIASGEIPAIARAQKFSPRAQHSKASWHSSSCRPPPAYQISNLVLTDRCKKLVSDHAVTHRHKFRREHGSPFEISNFKSEMTQLRGLDSNQRPQGYEPCKLPDCSTPRRSSAGEGFEPSSRETRSRVLPIGRPRIRSEAVVVTTSDRRTPSSFPKTKTAR